MAVGEVTFRSNVTRAICLLAAGTTTNSAPTDAAEGVPCYANGDAQNPTALWDADDSGAFFLNEPPDHSYLLISSTAGSGTMTCTATLYGYLAATGKWYPIKVNGGAAIAESGTDVIRYSERYEGLGAFDRLYLRVTLAGTNTAVEAYLVTPRKAGA